MLVFHIFILRFGGSLDNEWASLSHELFGILHLSSISLAPCNRQDYTKEKPFLLPQFISIKDQGKDPNIFLKCFHLSWSLVVIKTVFLKHPLGVNGPINSCNWVTCDNESTFTKNNKIDLFFYCNHQIVCPKVLIELYINLMQSYKKDASMLVQNKPHTDWSARNTLNSNSIQLLLDGSQDKNIPCIYVIF